MGLIVSLAGYAGATPIEFVTYGGFETRNFASWSVVSSPNPDFKRTTQLYPILRKLQGGIIMATA